MHNVHCAEKHLAGSALAFAPRAASDLHIIAGRQLRFAAEVGE
jgi:hypothetical protein